MHDRHKVSTLRWMTAGAVVAWWVLLVGNVPLVSVVGAGLLTLVFVVIYWKAAREYYDEHGYPGWE